MRRRQESPWLVAERNRVRTTPTQGILHRLADGETTFQAWRVENTTPIRKLARLTGIDVNRLLAFETGRALPHADELEVLAKELRVIPDLLMPPMAEPPDGERA
jgi:transcriptional regulator with XRE-family HTH domain